MRVTYLLRVAVVMMVFVVVAPAFAVLSASNLFPVAGYYSVNTGFYVIPPGTPGAPPAGGLVTLEGLVLTSPTGSIPPPVAPATALWNPGTFDATTFMSFFGGGTLINFNAGQSAAASITGLLDAPPAHTYDTEMLSLNLTGLPFGARIRESPTLASLGDHTIVDSPPSGYNIDSFFDVFTELSLDGGATWIPATGPVHITITPEPGSLTLLVCAGAPLISLRRRRAG